MYWFLSSLILKYVSVYGYNKTNHNKNVYEEGKKAYKYLLIEGLKVESYFTYFTIIYVLWLV